MKKITPLIKWDNWSKSDVSKRDPQKNSISYRVRKRRYALFLSRYVILFFLLVDLRVAFWEIRSKSNKWISYWSLCKCCCIKRSRTSGYSCATRTDNLPQTISASMGGSETLFCVRVRRFRTLPRSDIEGVPRRRDNGVRPAEIDSFENLTCKFSDPRVFAWRR